MTTKQPDASEIKRSTLGAAVRRFVNHANQIPGFRRTTRVVGIAIGRLYQDDGWAMASHLTLSGLMALFPFLIFMAAIAGVFGAEELADDAATYILDVMPGTVADGIANEVHRVLTGDNAGVITISLVVMFYLASNGVEAVRSALSRAYGQKPSFGLLYRRLQSLGFVVIGALAGIALALLGVFGPLIWDLLQRWVPALEDFNQSFQIFRYVIVGSLLTAALTAAHLWLPGRGNWRHLRIWPGIATTLALWWIATTAFAAYLKTFAHYVSTYAGLASIVTALIYLYIMSLLLIFGAEINAAIARTSAGSTTRHLKRKGSRPPPNPPANDD